MKKSKDLIVVSPHFDDAVLSIGGMMIGWIDEGIEVQVINVFTISTWTNPVYQPADKLSLNKNVVTRIRKIEERKVSRALNYRSIMLRYPDYSMRDLENDVTSDIMADLRNFITKGDQVFFPLGIDHPDHKVIAEIGIQMSKGGYNVCFYEDLPYAAQNAFDYSGMHKLLLQRELRPIVRSIDIKRKVEAISFYETQICESWIRDIVNYSYGLLNNMYMERYWVTSHNSG